ncbi:MULTISPECIES: GH39 family glycosyl hydrolase [Sphingobium]|uniref:Glycosyl hydrolase n=1 Tax=Sphingobium tyrosinilyticum TaxID=2715436 RepID=A0ABV9F046_9SPHN|nr:glycosyl hydrolase [Sphingobium sp. EP60837]ANI77931.1 Xylan 1,4-beta-xylosidase [Sphingobium sp. EP60837]
MNRRDFVAGAGAALTLGTATRGIAQAVAAPEILRVTIGSAIAGPLKHIWNAVGSDRAAITMRESWRRDIDQARKEIDLNYVRFHGILNDELGVYVSTLQRSSARTPNFKNVAEVYDGLVERDLSPIIELSFMPKKLAAGSSVFGYYRGINTPPTSYEDWGKFIGDFARFLVERYGIEKVARWPIEVWNEPNLAPWFWSGTQADYFKLYKSAAVAVKGIDQRLQVGGPATSATSWIPEFLAFCKAENAPVDFVSTHVYPGDAQKELFGSDLKLSVNDVVPEAVRRARAKVRASAFPNLPLYIDEWASDSPAMIAHVLANVLGEADMMSHWTLSGTYEELGPTDYLLQDGAMGFGMMNRGIPRPNYNTYRLLHALGDQRLVANGPTLASRRRDGRLAALVWNLAETSQPAGIPGANPARTVVGSAKRMVVSLPDLKPGQAIKVRYVDQERGSFVSAWHAMGSPKLPTLAQIATLRRASEIAPAQTVRLGPKRELQFDLPAEGVALIES